MTTRIGLAISADDVRVVVARRQRVLWHAQRAAQDGVGEAAEQLVKKIPPRLRRGARVRVAVGPSRCQLARLHGVPPRASAATVSQLVRAGIPRFFLGADQTLTTTDAEHRAGGWWAGSLPASLVNDIRTMLERNGLRAGEFVPLATLLPHALTGNRIVWPDGSVCADIAVADGEWSGVRRTRGSHAELDGTLRPTSGFAALAKEDIRYAGAYAAAMMAKPQRLAIRATSPQRVAKRSRAMRAGLLTVTLIAAIGALSASSVAEWYAGNRAQRTLDSLQFNASEVARTSYELRRATAVEAEGARFANGRRSMTALLGALSFWLPDSTAMISFHADSIGAMTVLLSPEGAGVLAALDSVPNIAGAQIVGPISLQTVNGASLQRLAIRFHFPGAISRTTRRNLPTVARSGSL